MCYNEIVKPGIKPNPLNFQGFTQIPVSLRYFGKSLMYILREHYTKPTILYYMVLSYISVGQPKYSSHGESYLDVYFSCRRTSC